MIHIIGQLLVGLLIGVVARILLPGKEAIASGMKGWLITALVGVAGSFLGTFAGRLIWRDQNYKAGWIVSIIGAIALLILLRIVF